MTYEEVLDFENKLRSKNYRRIPYASAEVYSTFEWYKAFYNAQHKLLYQVFFCFWDFETYREGAGWSISVVIMPESCKNNVGRRDLHLSVDWERNIDKVEKAAKLFYRTVCKIDVL